MHKSQMMSIGDKEITERMIKSIMPPLFTSIFGKPEDFKKSVNCMNQMRPLFIYPVKELSILFADIVGFTRMSSTKTAEQLVFLLNDLYGRFDKICEMTNCEKISTLGDCYYCVSGCLNGELDHAKCCVEMGLKMVKEIEIFNKIHKVDVNMRVGVHTGNALCGFIGGKRFRFDVWSSDVNLANKMESSGRSGAVHISEQTYNSLKNHAYTTEPGDVYLGKQTYFVMKDFEKKTVAEVLKQNANTISESLVVPQKVDQERKTSVEALKKKADQDEAELLSMTLKNGDFFQTDYNFLTMRFDSPEEEKYRSFIMDMKTKNQNEITSTISDKNFGKLLWTKPENLLFIGISVSFIVNLMLLVSFIILFHLSSYKLCIYQENTDYKTDTILIYCLFMFIFAFQIAFLLSYLFRCTLFINKNPLKKTFLFDKFSPIDSKVERPDQLRERKSQYTFIRYSILHLITIATMCIVPLFIISTMLPVLKHQVNSSFWPIVIDDYEVDLNATRCSEYIANDQPRLFNLFGTYSCMIFIVGLVQFCVHIQVSALLKTLVGFVIGAVFCTIGVFGVFDHFNLEILETTPSYFINDLNSIDESIRNGSYITFGVFSQVFFQGYIRDNSFLIIDIIFLILFIWLINRQSEFIYRLSYKCDQNARLKVKDAREQKDLANWLIEVVLPTHVISHVQLKKQYSKNYDCVGVLFLSLCNFSEFFEETFEGGRNLLRVLNEISVDFDRLFDEPQYANVEKIKSIGPTFMIASGLQNTENKPDKKHLYDLIDFALELNEKLEAFNNEAMSVCHFKFQIRMGFHCGPVTAGVIGTDRLLYDIWGDTVNVASRMDSTGMSGIMQTTEEVTKILGDSYKFQYRGPVNIKGKDSMTTYLMNPKENIKACK